MNPDLLEKLQQMRQMGYKVMTVSDLVQRLAGLPPMMEIFVDADGTPMFLNDTQIQRIENDEKWNPAPFLRIICNPHPVKTEPLIEDTTYEEKLARQRQRAMDMSAQIERETQMHPMVD